MSNSYYIKLKNNCFPSSAEIESFAKSIEPSFKLDKNFDYRNDRGVCSCKYKNRKQSFEWDYIVDGSDISGELIYSSDTRDGICAILTAASIAFLSEGYLQQKEHYLSGRDILTYAREEIDAYVNQLKTYQNTKKKSVDGIISKVLEDLKGIKVKQLIKVDENMSDPLISVVFPDNNRIISKRWTICLLNGFTFSTQALPVYRLSTNEMKETKEAFEKIRHLMLMDTIKKIILDKKNLDITIEFVSGALIFHAFSTYQAIDEESKLFLNINQEWEFIDSNGNTITPNIKLKKLIIS